MRNFITNFVRILGISKISSEIISATILHSLIASSISLRSWYASYVNISASHFTTLIKTATGKTPSEWIATVTITYAKLYLKQRDKNIKQIAAELNFPEQFTFRKYFKKHTGVSPKEYQSILSII